MCKGRCGGSRSYVSDRFFIKSIDGYPTSTVSFNDNRILRSSSKIVRIIPDVWYEVYNYDLHNWIISGVRGITFKDEQEEKKFLYDFTDIRKHHYE